MQVDAVVEHRRVEKMMPYARQNKSLPAFVAWLLLSTVCLHQERRSYWILFWRVPYMEKSVKL
jgi:ribosomal protein L39E